MIFFRKVLIRLLYLLSPVIPSKIYLKMLFPLRTGYRLNLNNPQTYNEKLQWLKLYYRDSDLPHRVDKYEYKEWAAKIVDEKYLPQTYGIWESFDNINFDLLPNAFVLKTTHDQGGVVICYDKSAFDKIKTKKKLEKHLKKNIFHIMKEWPYKNVKPRIMAEELLVDNSKGDIWDYKFYCFDGKPIYMYISMNRQSSHTPFYFYDMEFNFLDITRPGYEHDSKKIEKPENWNLMIKLAEKLSSKQPHVRIDFYNINGRIYLGEYTLFQGGGMMPFNPEIWDYKFGSFLSLPRKLK